MSRLAVLYSYLRVPKMGRHIIALAAELECDDLVHCVVGRLWPAMTGLGCVSALGVWTF